jgi:outer membrane autotransporter protein
LVYSLGASIAYLWEIAPTYLILPTIGLSWQHEFLNYGYTVNANFAGRSGFRNHNFSTVRAPRNNAFGMAGITAQFGQHLGAYAYYNPQFGGGQISSQGVVVGLTYAF